MDEVKLSFGTVTYRKPILFIRYEENVTLYEKEINEIIVACHTLCGNDFFVVSADMTSYVNMTPEASKLTREKMSTLNIAASAHSKKAGAATVGQCLYGNTQTTIPYARI